MQALPVCCCFIEIITKKINNMKKVLLSILLLSVSIAMSAQDKVPNVLRYYMKDKTTYDVHIAELDRLQKVGTIGWNNIFNNGQGNKAIMFADVDSMVFVYDSSVPDIVIVTNGNENQNTDPRAQLLEYPRLSEEGLNILSIHKTNDYGITYSLEWDCNKRAQRWTCYEMHNGNSEKNVSRTDAWAADPNIPSQYQSSQSDYSGSGFSRGHMCPSGDRLCSKEQNKQTFYFSNMHPQYQNHNGVLWEKMEEQVRKWNSASFRDTLYVVKAGTIRDDQLLMHTSSGLPVPQYFYMAVLCKKNDTFKALAFWTVHENKSIKNANLAEYAISIKELEERTGIDFFCNLPDDIEVEVEKEVNVKDWGL